MAQTAAALIEEQMNCVQEQILSAAVQHVTANMGTLPVPGTGFGFMKRSMERQIRSEIKDTVTPQIEEYLSVQLEYVTELAAAEDPEGVHDRYREDLLELDPFLTALDPSSAAADDIRAEAWEAGKNAAERVAAWIEATEGETFDDFTTLVHRLGKTPEDIAAETEQLLFYIDMMERYRDHLDLSTYSPVLNSDTVHDWFLQHLPTGLKHGRDHVIEDVQKRLVKRQELE